MLPIVNSFQKNTQSVDIMLKIETQKKEALLLKVFSFVTKNLYKYTTNENISILVLNAKKNSFPVLLFVGKVVFLLLPWRS